MNTDIKILGINELVHKFTMKKKHLLAGAINTYYECQAKCYTDVLKVNEKCEIKCQRKLEDFDQIKKQMNGKYDAFLLSYDMDDMARIDNKTDGDSLRRQL